MAYLGNTPSKETILRLEARKSFSFVLAVKDAQRRAVDLTGASLRIVMKALPLDVADADDDDNLIAEPDAVPTAPDQGLVRFDIQAADLNWPTGEYPFVVVLTDSDGFSTVLVKGLVDLVQNTEFNSLASLFSTANPTQQLEVLLRGTTAIDVVAGSALQPAAPGWSRSTAAPASGVDGDVHLQYFTDGTPARVWTNVAGTWR